MYHVSRINLGFTSWIGIIHPTNLQDWSLQSWWWRPSQWRMLGCRESWARPPTGSQPRSPGPRLWSGSVTAPSPAPPSSACPGQTASCSVTSQSLSNLSKNNLNVTCSSVSGAPAWAWVHSSPLSDALSQRSNGDPSKEENLDTTRHYILSCRALLREVTF